MLSLSNTQIRRALTLLVGFHIIIVCASNYLVQLPFTLFGWHTTWGAFSFPFVYLATDLTVRIFGQKNARRIIFKAMLPALVVSYVIGVLFHQGIFQGMDSLANYNSFVLRIAAASFAAYLFGQLLDIKVFANLRLTKSWWIAPTASTLLGNLLDTLIFFSLAFYASTDEFMAANWPEIAMVDYGFKLLVSLCLFLPAYGVLLKVLEKRIIKLPDPVSLA
ncbi:7-cyano-7-deazaguanine/7-aminomethyl-7-deazaguanine transporter [Psychromonas sp. L1A2]|uniref:7-cyano-7-deazaguanine/7-aminomethyl-7- deazaguanine transporter n=1 Tax=Psychromonas sp. L1A2 TaxID=2686356 RepID=UPI001358D90B|nr:7-cyano-7-deazaguanine/7-aminomethyl-7-deazaguanine transporter [Psychromonas sp. L1A2]